MNDLQLHIYQLLQEMDSSENDQIEEVTIENVKKSKGKCKEKFLTLSSKSIALGERSSGAETEIEEKPEIENLLHIVEKESTKDSKK